MLQVGLLPPSNAARPPRSYRRRCRPGCVRRGAGKSAAGLARCRSVRWAAHAAFLPLEVLPKQAIKPADYRVNVAFKSPLLVWKARARHRHRSQELLHVQCADPAEAEASTGLLTPAMCSCPGDGVFGAIPEMHSQFG